MRPGEVLAERFVIERLAGAGGMGEVYRARDRDTGAPVAIKILRAGGADAARFAREARVLSDLTHPSIVRYVGHGAAAGGELFLAMEWLEGEDLARRLERSPLSVAESLAIARGAAAGLAPAHARGIVHRDVKPSNLFLMGGDPARVKLLDFGVARERVRVLTRTGALVGTIGYMSPEQARGERELDARTDVFALGCVLFECLTGHAAFAGESPVAVLAKVLLDEPPHARDLRPDLPAVLDNLLARMLARDPAGRPADAAVVLQELDALDDAARAAPAPAAAAVPWSASNEQRVVSVIVVERVPDADPLAATVAPGEVPQGGGGIAALLTPFGADVVATAGGTVLAMLAGQGSAADRARQAAACALSVREAHPDARIVLATGRAETGGRHPTGPAIDRAAGLLAASWSNWPGGVRVDDVTAGLLDARFELKLAGSGHALTGRGEDTAGARKLLGRVTPCVGREKEFALLEGTYAECVGDSVARAVLVTAPPGTGKSRLGMEFLARLRARREARLLFARADPLGCGSSLGLVRQLIRRAAGIRDGEPAGARYSQLARYLGGLPATAAADGARGWEFLGEIVGAPAPDPGPLLRAARDDARLMGEQARRAFREWLAAECAVRPVVVMLEDLHWGDSASAAYIGEALRALADQPLMVLALARPEAADEFPGLWRDTGAQEIRLAGLTRRSSERLVRAVLGDAVDPEVLARIVARADGNAYYLEELIRDVAEGGGEAMPETVLAMAQSRLERLEPAARRVLQAASVFGEAAWRGGVAALLARAERTEGVADWLQALTDRELLAERSPARFAAEAEYAFRHGLLRDAAYAMLTEPDRRAAHRVAAEWLERAGETDALIMAEHCERGGNAPRAAYWLAQAARAALDAGSSERAEELAERGLACGAAAEVRGLLCSVKAQASFGGGDMARIHELTREATSLVPAGGQGWFALAGWQVMAAYQRGDAESLLAILEQVLALQSTAAPTAPFAFVMYFLMQMLVTVGRFDMAVHLADRLESSARTSPTRDAVFEGYRWLAQVQIGAYVRGNLGAAVHAGRRAVACVEGVPFHFPFALQQAAWALIDAGCFDEARARLGESAASCEKGGGLYMRDWAHVWLAKAEAYAGRGNEAVALAAPLAASPNVLLACSAWSFLAEGHLAAGRLADAEAAAREAEARSFVLAPRAIALSVRARVALAAGDARGALELAERGLAVWGDAPSVRIDASVLRLARVEALRALGDARAARAALEEARARIERIAATLTEAADRDAYLQNIEANARTCAMAARDRG